MSNLKDSLSRIFSKNNLISVLLILAVVLIAYQYFSQKSLVKKHKQEMTETRQNLQNEATFILSKNTELQLGLLLKTFVWAVRSAMIRDNLDEVDQYFNQLVKEEKVKAVVLVGQNLEILVATNKKYETRPFSEFYNTELLSHEDIFLTNDNNIYQVSAPVLSLNTRLGTLVLIYEGNTINFLPESEQKAEK